MLADPTLEFAFEFKVLVAAPQNFGTTTYGQRRVVPVIGGTFEGPAIRGVILPGGSDWQTVRADGTIDLEARYTLQTDDGVLILIENRGIRTGSPDVLARLAQGQEVSPAEYYMRSYALFETGDNQYGWLSHTVFVGTGMRSGNQVTIRFYKVL